MEVQAALPFLLLVIPASLAFQWTSSSQIPDGSSFRACVGERASFPWSFSLSTGEHVINVEWYRTTGKGQVLVAALVADHFLPTAGQNVTFVPVAGLQVVNVSLAEFGTYRVRVSYNINGSLLSSQQTAFLTMEDAPVLAEGQLVARVSPKPVLDDVTRALHMQLTCGHFLSLGTRPVAVVWKTPSDRTVASTAYFNGTFHLNLPHPTQGGGYYCHLKDPSVAARCIPNVSRLMRGAYVHVDEVQIRLTLLEGGLHGLQAKDEKLDREMDRQADLDLELQSREQNLTAKVGRLAEITDMLLTRTEKLTSDNERLKTQTEKLTSDNEKLKTQTEKLMSDNERLKTQTEKLTSDNERLKTQTEKLTSDNERLKTQTEKLTSDNERLKTQTEKLMSDNKRITSDNENLWTQAENLTSDNYVLKSQMQSMASQLKEETAKLSSRADNMATNTSELSTQLLALKCRIVIIEKNSCLEIRQCSSTSGVHAISLHDLSSVRVYCDQVTDGGGWTVIQRRQDGSVNFTRNWMEYENGFGDLSGEFWLGLRNIYLLTSSDNYSLRVDLTDWYGSTGYALYATFNISGPEDNYRLHISGYSGTIGDSLEYHKNMQFSTPDREHDKYSTGHCAELLRSGWWFRSCTNSNLNGPYGTANTRDWKNAMYWYHWHNDDRSYKRAEMKIRPRH